MIFYQVIRFVTANPWRTAAMLSAGVIMGLLAGVQTANMRVDSLALERDKALLQIRQMEVESTARQNQIAAADRELGNLRKRQAADAKRIKALLSSWPVECNDAAAVALLVIQQRRGE